MIDERTPSQKFQDELNQDVTYTQLGRNKENDWTTSSYMPFRLPEEQINEIVITEITPGLDLVESHNVGDFVLEI
ncbi:MAG: hypothetical protein FWE31_02245 [Firmicutes bacterium]|nr:hypothetical protein [Bacillota bacterium]